MHKVTLVLLLVCVGIAMSATRSRSRNSPKQGDFESYKEHHRKEYQSDHHEEEAERHFNRNKAKIDRHNKLFAEGKVKYKMELNKFADIPSHELTRRNGHKLPHDWREQVKKLKGKKSSGKNSRKNTALALAYTTVDPPPPTFDWRNVKGKNYVSPVKNQDCYAFSAVAAMESQILIKKLPPQSLSEQQIAQCSTYLMQQDGCYGAPFFMQWEYVKSIKDAGGLTTSDQYPYTIGHTDYAGPCEHSDIQGVQTVSDWDTVDSPNDTTIMQYLVQKGPLVVGINTGDLAHAGSGIYHNPNMDTDHAVLLVGYGTDSGDNGGNYWLIKNSWGKDWGMDGFFKISRDAGQNANIGEMFGFVSI